MKGKTALQSHVGCRLGFKQETKATLKRLNRPLVLSPVYMIIHLVKNIIIHLHDDANGQTYDRVKCIPNKFLSTFNMHKLFNHLAACFIFATGVKTFDDLHGQMYDHVDQPLLALYRCGR